MPAFGVGTADTRDALKIVTTGTEPIPDLLDTFKAIPAVGGGVLLIVAVAEIGEMPFEDGMELVATTGTYRFVAMVATEIAARIQIYKGVTSFLLHRESRFIDRNIT